ncbi:hypothetical protein ACPPVW_17550 [Leifsonia sp. McL0607]
MWTLSCPGRPVGLSEWMERVVLDLVYLLAVAVLAFVVALVGRGVEKL